MHAGNLRRNNKDNRYSNLFSEQYVSYWADSPETAKAEMKKHGRSKNLLTFMAYDDATASFPTLSKKRTELLIVDGRDLGFHYILEKIDNNIELSKEDVELIKKIESYKPDCLAYKSMACTKGVNFLFFKKGFKKLAIRYVKLVLGERKQKNRQEIQCSYSCDYNAYPEYYGYSFEKLARTKMNNKYLATEEYRKRPEIMDFWHIEYRRQNLQKEHIEIDRKTGKIIK